MYHLLTSASGSFNVFCDKICDTTGTSRSIKECFSHFSQIKVKHYENLQDFMEQTNYKIIICSFKSKTFAEFENEYPELLI